MTNTSMPGAVRARPPFFQVTGLCLHLWPIVLAVVLMQVILFVGQEIARGVFLNITFWSEHIWVYVGLAGLFQALLGLIGIVVMRRLLPTADSHLRWPPGRSYIGLAIFLGILMGLIMLAADYWPQLLSQTAPDAAYSLAPLDVTGWLAVMLATGLSEETVFRGLLVGMLVVLTPGRVRIGRFEIPVAGVIVALLFGIAHWKTFLVNPLHLAVAQQVYAFVWGVIYVWLMERSRSLAAPIVAHGVGNFVEVGLVMIMMSAWA